MSQFHRTWLITGCATGFGATLAQTLLDQGERVVATDKDANALDHLTTDNPDNLLTAGLNVTADASIKTAVQTALDRFGRIDILVNNAGLGLGGPFEEVNMQEADLLMNVNAMGPMRVTHAVLPHMRQRGTGHIINISSDSGKVGFPFQNVYTASKFALEGFSECLYHEITPFGLKVTIIEPCGAYRTPMPTTAVERALANISPDSPYYDRTVAIAQSMEGGHMSDPQIVADAIIEVANLSEPPLRQRVGPDDRTGLVGLRNQMPDEEYVAFVRKITSGPAPVQKARTGTRNGGRLVMETLADAGVTHCFTIVGGHNYEFVDACQDVGLEVIDVRHEQQAAHIADGMARFTRQMQTIAIDGAPGLVNAVPGIQVAYESQVPLFILTAQGSLEGRDIGVMQAIDQLELVRPITKWQRTCFETKRLPEYTAMAIRYATTGRPGPVFLDMPLEVMRGSINAEEAPIPQNYRPEGVPHANPEQIDAALKLLSEAERPLIIAGSGVHWAAAGDALRHLIDKTGIPFMLRNIARGLVPDDHPQGVHFMPSGAAGADVYLVIGTRLDWTVGYGRFPLFDTDAKVIHIDIKPEAIGKTRPVDIGLVGDAGAVLRQLNTRLDRYSWQVSPTWLGRATGGIKALRQGTLDSLKLDERTGDMPIHTMELIHAVRDWVSRDTITVVDGGYSAAFAIEQMDALSHGSVTWVGSTGHLGVGVAYAIAAKLAHPERPVVALMGDGAFGLCAMEFDTAVRFNLPIIVVIANDEGWGETRDGQRKRYGDERVIGTQLGATRYDKMAEALGGYGELVEKVEGIEPALNRALNAGKPAIINVHTDPNARSAVVSSIPWVIE